MLATCTAKQFIAEILRPVIWCDIHEQLLIWAVPLLDPPKPFFSEDPERPAISRNAVHPSGEAVW